MEKEKNLKPLKRKTGKLHSTIFDDPIVARKKGMKKNQMNSFNKEDIRRKIASQDYMDHTVMQIADEICHYVQ